MRVDPEHAAGTERLGETAERADRDRVVAAEDEGTAPPVTASNTRDAIRSQVAFTSGR